MNDDGFGVAVLALLAAIGARAPVARAEAEDQAAARALFEQGRALMKNGQFPEACPKLEAARELYTSAGILLNLADCHEKIGRTASAWTEFGEAAAVAKRTNRDADADEATRRQTELAPKLARLTIAVPHAVPGLSVERDGAPIAPPPGGASLPVDPGDARDPRRGRGVRGLDQVGRDHGARGRRSPSRFPSCARRRRRRPSRPRHPARRPQRA